MEFKTNTGAIAITIIILIIALPKTGYFMDYRLDYCNDYDRRDKIGLHVSTTVDIQQFTEPVDIYHNGFFACEIGFINAKVEITIDLFAYSNDFETADRISECPGTCDLEYMILDKQNYEDFVSGKIYAQPPLSSLSGTWTGEGSTYAYDDLNLLYDSYYFVVNWEYRIAPDEDIKRNYGETYTDLSGDIVPLSFYYTIDIDYTDDNLEGNL